MIKNSPQPTFSSGLGAYTFLGFCLAADSGKIFVILLKFRKEHPSVPEGGELPITAGGMTEGNGTCG